MAAHTGICSVCGEERALIKRGVMRQHDGPPEPGALRPLCPGSGRPPKTDQPTTTLFRLDSDQIDALRSLLGLVAYDRRAEQWLDSLPAEFHPARRRPARSADRGEPS